MRLSNYAQSQMDAKCAEQDDERLADIRRKSAQCKNSGNVEVGHSGECLKCGAEQGIACRAPLSTDAKLDALRAALG